jgi:hypothetical protein
MGKNLAIPTESRTEHINLLDSKSSFQHVYPQGFPALMQGLFPLFETIRALLLF